MRWRWSATLLLSSALALAVGLAFVSAGTGFSGSAGPIRVRLHNPFSPLIVACLLTGALIAVSWQNSRRRSWTLGAAAAVVALAAVILLRAGERIFPLADIAVLEIFVRDALADKLLVGPYSRFGWHHPGPLYFYLIAPMYALAGRHPVALAGGAATLVMGATALLAWSAARSFGSAVTAGLLAFTTIYLWRIPDLATSPWNPHVVLIPVIAFLVVSASLASGDFAMLPIVAVLATFIVQTDIALVPVVAAVTLVAVMAGVATGELRTNLAWLAVTSWILAGLWFLPAAEQVTHTPGNLTLLWRFFVDNPGQGQSFSTARTAWAVMTAAPLGPNFLLATGGTFVAHAARPALIVTLLELLALAVIAAWANRAGYTPLSWLAKLAVVASLVALWSVTRIQERIMDHEVFWVTALGTLNLGVIAGFCGLFVEDRLKLRVRSLEPVELIPAMLMALCMFVCVTQLERARAGHMPVTLSTPVAERFGASVGNYVNEEQVRKPLFRIGEEVWGMAAGTLLELNRAGVPFAVEDSWLPMFPQTFTATGDEDAEISVSDTNAHLQLASRPGNVLVTSSDTVFIDAVRVAPKRRR